MNLLLNTAKNRGVIPSLSLISVSAPFSISKLVVHLLPEKYFSMKMKTDRNECVFSFYVPKNEDKCSGVHPKGGTVIVASDPLLIIFGIARKSSKQKIEIESISI